MRRRLSGCWGARTRTALHWPAQIPGSGDFLPKFLPKEAVLRSRDVIPPGHGRKLDGSAGVCHQPSKLVLEVRAPWPVGLGAGQACYKRTQPLAMRSGQIEEVARNTGTPSRTVPAGSARSPRRHRVNLVCDRRSSAHEITPKAGTAPQARRHPRQPARSRALPGRGAVPGMRAADPH